MSKKINSDLLALTYGEVVSQVLRDSEDVYEANQLLLAMGRNMGGRMVDEFLAKEGRPCRMIEHAVENLVKKALPMFLGVQAEHKDYGRVIQKKRILYDFRVILKENPLLEFVEVPGHLKELQYQNIVAGAILGAFEIMGFKGEVQTEQDSALDKTKPTVFKVSLVKLRKEED